MTHARNVTEALMALPPEGQFRAVDTALNARKLKALVDDQYLRRVKVVVIRSNKHSRNRWNASIYEMTDLGRQRRDKGLRSKVARACWVLQTTGWAASVQVPMKHGGRANLWWGPEQ